MPPTVVTAFGNSDDAQLERDLLKAVDANLVHVANLDSPEAGALIRQADALIVTTHRVSADLIASMERCQIISRAGTGLDHFFQGRGTRRVALAGKAEIHRKRIRSLDHARDVPRTGRAGGGESAVRRSRPAAEQRGNA